ncbi:MAG: dCTP deaminase [Thaumarchaeota archaeon]|jgi:dCTP deaminase|nr:dCTP deaminase [Candidatus Geocrenenecus arthurdayi]MCL7390023.1 dCTP deaminase [Candidatus Geocrenenecus arthurdayi]MCL7391017.1 dCTP deaminase [Candidatus Geocrenenecus arthurdayi]MCL7396139.1 dCTP deaminase [Candidatus Geocrenenecus arthurdayi]MCL7401357.1 dCTP deaminase [Candidatus Geocrenenecus arthurdayi]
MILSDRDIIEYVSRGLLITPSSEVFENNLIGPNSVDLRVNGRVVRLKNKKKVLDLENIGNINGYFIQEDCKEFIVKPREHLLLSSIEYLKLPVDIMGFVSLKSTYARLGLSIPPTIVNAGSEGELTIELIGGPFPVKIRRGDRIVQIVFVKLSSPTQKPYSGRYQNQRGPTIPRI